MQLNKFVQRYKSEGPGTVGLDLDRGAELMELYGKEFETMEKQRIELGKQNCCSIESNYLDLENKKLSKHFIQHFMIFAEKFRKLGLKFE